MKDRGSSWALRAISSIVLAYIMLRPVSSGNILYPLLAILGVASFIALILGRRRASLEVVGVLTAVLLVALYGSIVGADNPGWSQHTTVWILGPLLFGVWALAADERMLKSVFFTATWTTIVLSAIIILWVASNLGGPAILPEWVTEQSNARFNLEGDATAIGFYGLSTLTAAAPMSIIAAFAQNSPLLPHRSIRVIAAVLATIAALLGGRNVIVLVIVVVPLLALAVRQLWRRRNQTVKIHPGVFLAGLALLGAAPLVIPLATNNPAMQRTWHNIVGFFAKTGDQLERNQQITHLMNGWSQSFVFGNGFGATIPGYSRSAERPWNFEMQYHMLLFQLGLVGLVLLIVVAFLAVRAIVRAAKVRPDLLSPLMVACAAAVGMLISNATNPYLQAPGHMWAVWLPLMVANVALCSPQASEKQLKPRTAASSLNVT